MKAIILSISSDIGLELSKTFITKNFEVFGTYNKSNPKTNIPNKNLLKIDIKDFNSEIFKKWLENIGEWDVFISCIGNLNPVGKLSNINSSEWVESVAHNSSFQIGALLNALKYRNLKGSPSVIFFAGGGTNSATEFYSAYTVGKICLIKSVELLDYEIEDTKFTILGPGWVRTKIHNQTLKAKSNAGMNYKKTLDMLATPNKFNPIKKVIDDVFKIIELPKELVSGRNFSSVHDDISLKKLKELYSIDKDFYRLRRNLNYN
tara:strand:- start:26 stop:811 length:786 start_codon:yes stop_codon:yes gene_type:complete